MSHIHGNVSSGVGERRGSQWASYIAQPQLQPQLAPAPSSRNGSQASWFSLEPRRKSSNALPKPDTWSNLGGSGNPPDADENASVIFNGGKIEQDAQVAVKDEEDANTGKELGSRLFSNFTFGGRRPSTAQPQPKSPQPQQAQPPAQEASAVIGSVIADREAERERRAAEHRLKLKQRKAEAEEEEKKYAEPTKKKGQSFKAAQAPPVPEIPANFGGIRDSTVSTFPATISRQGSVAAAPAATPLKPALRKSSSFRDSTINMVHNRVSTFGSLAERSSVSESVLSAKELADKLAYVEKRRPSLTVTIDSSRRPSDGLLMDRRPSAMSVNMLRDVEEGTGFDTIKSSLSFGDSPTKPETAASLPEFTPDSVYMTGPPPTTNISIALPAEPAWSTFSPYEHLSISRRLAHAAMIFPYAMLGYLVRLGFKQMGDYAGRGVVSLIWSQGVGCAIAGLVVGKREDLLGIYPPLYTALLMGFASSINNFAEWMLETFMAFTNYDSYSRFKLQSAMDGIGQLLLTALVAYGALAVGQHLASCIPRFPGVKHAVPPTPVLDQFIIFISFALYALAVIAYVLFPISWRPDVTFPLIFAPVGALIRYYMMRCNGATTNPQKGSGSIVIPLGTYFANFLGTAGFAACFILQRSDIVIVSGLSCQLIGAIGNGLCGCLTSLSMMMLEIKGIWRTELWRWAYVVLTVFSGQATVFAIVGAIWWTQGRTDMCSLVASN